MESRGEIQRNEIEIFIQCGRKIKYRCFCGRGTIPFFLFIVFDSNGGANNNCFVLGNAVVIPN